MKDFTLFKIEVNPEHLKKGSLTGLIIVVIILFGSYYDFFKYVNLQINNTVVFVSWIYLFVNIGVANTLKYLSERKMPECPECHKKLKFGRYICDNCGILKFEKNKKGYGRV